MEFYKSFGLSNCGAILFSFIVLVQISCLLKKALKKVTDLTGDEWIYKISETALTHVLELTEKSWSFLQSFFLSWSSLCDSLFGQIIEDSSRITLNENIPTESSPILSSLNESTTKESAPISKENSSEAVTGNPSSGAIRSAGKRKISAKRARRSSEEIVVRRLRSGTVYGVALRPAGLNKKKSQTQETCATEASIPDSSVDSASESEATDGDLKSQTSDSAQRTTSLLKIFPISEGKTTDVEVLKYGRSRAELRKPSTIHSLGFKART